MAGFCDMLCKYAEFFGGENDGAGCRTNMAVYCTKKKQTVFKNMLCKEKELRNGSFKGRDKNKKT